MQVPYCQMPEAEARSLISHMLSCYPVNMACMYYTRLRMMILLYLLPS